MSKRLLNRIALITGSSSGLGRAIALAFATEGAVIFCVDLYPSSRNAINASTGKADDIHNRIGGQGTHERIRQAGGEATYHRADLTKSREVELAVRACVARYGRLDVMVNNAGMYVGASLDSVL
jgi:NAD(P)-dependent dehydrogenase (short-subunit alcohol dehydrogenase family)